jgi:hypothetical protein
MTADQQAAEKARSARQAGCLHDRFAIDPNAPLVEFTTVAAQAFAAADLLNPGRLLFALICEPDLPVRAVARERLGQASLPGLMQIVDHGVLDWPPRKRRCEAIVYPRPQGGAMAASYGHSGRTVPEHAISRWIAPPIAQALHALDDLAIAHRAIRLDNIFFVDSGRVELVLGDRPARPWPARSAHTAEAD